MRRDEALLAVAKLTTEDRNQTHGDPIAQFETAQQLKNELARGPHWMDLNAVEREAMEMICTKLSRMVHGDPTVTTTDRWQDHMLDIIGYASIAVESRDIPLSTASEQQTTYVHDQDQEGAAAIAAKFAPRTPAERATRD